MNDDYISQIRGQAEQQAKHLNHQFVTVEHILLALLEASDAEVIEALEYNYLAEFDRTILIEELQHFLDQHTPPKQEDEPLRETIGFRRVLDRAIRLANEKQSNAVTPVYVLLAIFYEQENKSVRLINKQNITRKDILDYLSQTTPKAPLQKPTAQANPLTEMLTTAMVNEKTKRTNIDDFLINLNQQFREGKSSPLIGRAKEVEATIRVLSQTRKSNPILVGEPGVGKTTIAAGLAELIEKKKVPPVLRRSTVYALDMTAMLAGTQFRGEFEKRIQAILNFLRQDQYAILFIDEIHMIIGAGSTSGSQMDVANILKPALASGELSCIGATTYKEFRSFFEKDAALTRRFQKVDIPEPSVEETVAILKGLRERLERHHRLIIRDDAIEAAATLAKQYIKDRQLPDIAIDLLDEAGAAVNMMRDQRDEKAVQAADVKQVVAHKVQMPIEKLATEQSDVVKHLAPNLKASIFGQDHAIDSLVSVVSLSYAGLRETNKPMASFLFAGPTGVGKTELVKQLSYQLGVKLHRFDMSEFRESHSVSKLIGAPPGYVGHDQAGLLTEAVNKDPHAVVLLDEIEKAHPDIYNLLLQVMDYGTLTDSHGRKIDFQHAILIMTTNAGAEMIFKPTIGFTSDTSEQEDAKVALSRVFTPEFRNRLDEVIYFNPLPKDVMHHIVLKHIKHLEALLEPRGVTLELSEEAIQWLSKHGYDKQMGARPMERLVADQLKKPLAEHLLHGDLAKGGHVIVNVSSSGLVFE